MINNCIYKISSKLKPERFYIGSTVNFRHRQIQHLHCLRKNKYLNSRFQHHFNKYGEQDLSFEILEYVEDTTKLLEREQFYLDNLHPYFNTCKIAGNQLGFHHSEETKKKLSKINIGKKLSEETKRKISQNSARKGKPRPEETLKKIKETKSKRTYIVSEETKIKMSLAKIGISLDQNHKEKIRQSGLGRKDSDEVRKKKSESRKGIKFSQITLQKMSNARKGKPAWNKGLKGAVKQSSETIQKRQETRKRNQLNKISKII